MEGATKEDVWSMYTKLMNVQSELRQLSSHAKDVKDRADRMTENLEALRREMYDHYTDPPNPYRAEE